MNSYGANMIYKVLEKIGYSKVRAEALLSLVYMIHCHDHNIEFRSEDKDKWLKSKSFKSIEECYDWLNDYSQSKMLRPKNVERLQHIPPEYVYRYFYLILKYLKQLDLIDDRTPKHSEYDAILFLGAAQNSMEDRIKTLVKILYNGYKAKEVYILSGERDLWPKHEVLTPVMIAEKIAKKNKLSSKEFGTLYHKVCHQINKMLPEDMLLRNKGAEINAVREKIRDIFEHRSKERTEYPSIKWPSEVDLVKRLLKNYRLEALIKIKYIDVPKKSSGRRPTTMDGVICFEEQYRMLTKSNRKSKLLIISSQPYIEYQTTIVKSILSEKYYDIESIGSGNILTSTKSVAICLDSIARSIYAAKFRVYG